MKAASIHELKKSLANLDRDELLDACVRLAKYKVDNKELLTYLLIHADDEQGYADAVCDEIDEQLPAAHSIHKKTMRKIVRWMDKYIRYSGNKETELRIRIHLKKIEKAMEKLHPDLQFDYRYQMQGLDSRPD